MLLPNTEFTPPGYRIERVCKNCHYYTPRGSGVRGRFFGECRLEQLSNPEAKPRPTHGTCTCDAHTIKTIGRNFHRIHDAYNAPWPESGL